MDIDHTLPYLWILITQKVYIYLLHIHPMESNEKKLEVQGKEAAEYKWIFFQEILVGSDWTFRGTALNYFFWIYNRLR